MSLDKVSKLKTPKLPKEVDDKDVKKALDGFDKTLPAFLKAVNTFSVAFSTQLTAGIAVEEAISKKSDERNIDPKMKKALEDLDKEVRGINKLLWGLA